MSREVYKIIDEVAMGESTGVKFAGPVLVKPSGEGEELKRAGLNLSSAATIVVVIITVKKLK